VNVFILHLKIQDYRLSMNRYDLKIDDSFYKVEEIRPLTDETFSLKLPKPRFAFLAGQHISLGIKGDYQSREYSIYSGVNDETLEILVKEVENGYFTPKLRKLKAGDFVEIHGPFGKFGMEPKDAATGKFVFIASGTGIAPFRSIVRTYPEIDYKLIHGVRYSKEAYDRTEYNADRYVLCSSRDALGDYQGRLTGYLKNCLFAPETQFYLCGNSDMIFDALEILKDKGFDRDQIHCEVYF
jgi:ferredoxin--NADP+ reductase/benzoate/toluate 1,2-dioxygenase reductase subunit